MQTHSSTFSETHVHMQSDAGMLRTDLFLHIVPGCCSSLRLTALRFKARCCTQLPAQDFLIRVGDLASASPRNKSPSLSGAFPPALLSGISLSERWLSSPDIFVQEKRKMETVCVCVCAGGWASTRNRFVRRYKRVEVGLKCAPYVTNHELITCFLHHQNAYLL